MPPFGKRATMIVCQVASYSWSNRRNETRPSGDSDLSKLLQQRGDY